MTADYSLFADILLPVPLSTTFTYRVPAMYAQQLGPGFRVVVPFGKVKAYTGVVVNVHNRAPSQEAKYIIEVLDDEPSVTAQQLSFFQWLADYYVCTPGEVLNVALPSGLKLSSETHVELYPQFDERHLAHLDPDEYRVMELLMVKESVRFDELRNLLDNKQAYATVQKLAKLKLVIVFEQVRERYSPKLETRVKLNPQLIADGDQLQAWLGQLEKKPAQYNTLLTALDLLGFSEETPALLDIDIARKTLLASPSVSESGYRSLLKKEILLEFKSQVSRLAQGKELIGMPTLSPAQAQARDEILTQLLSKDQVYLYGITGSGKTEVYIDIIQKVLETGQQVLFLLPEIGLTTQIMKRLALVFGQQLGAFHSKMTENERVEVWQGAKSGVLRVIVGARSALFLPFTELGLIIIDEEHESSFKQLEMAPLYHARDAALVLARMAQAKVLMGSATPSIETYYQAESGKWGLVKLTERYGDAQLPAITLVDMIAARKAGSLRHHFSGSLLDAIKANKAEGKQTILFQNRRGYAPYLSCTNCGYVQYCVNCDVALTYHQAHNELRCHYCSHIEQKPKECPTCKGNTFKPVGFGTEKVEDDLKDLLPDFEIARMDQDSMRKKQAMDQLLDAMQGKSIDVLVGTQMVTKGLDFAHVTLVGVFDIDRLLHYPDFRSKERVFQLVTQVAGRAGRRSEQGQVMVQTANPNQPVLQYILDNDYISLYQDEVAEREQYFYPPFSRLIRVTLKNEIELKVSEAAQWVKTQLVAQLPEGYVLGPEPPSVAKIRGQFLQQILLKIPNQAAVLKQSKLILQQVRKDMPALTQFKNTQLVIDVDPV